MFPAFVAGEDLDLDAQEINRHFDIGFRQMRHTDRVLLRRYDHFQIAPDAAIDEALQLRFSVTMMVDVTFCQLDARAKFSQSAFEALRRGDAADRPNKSVAQTLQRHSFA